MGFFHPPLLNLAMQPNGTDRAKRSIRAMCGAKGKLKVVSSTMLIVVKASSRNMPFNQKPTCQPFVLCRMLMTTMFRTPSSKGWIKYVIVIKKKKPNGGI